MLWRDQANFDGVETWIGADAVPAIDEGICMVLLCLDNNKYTSNDILRFRKLNKLLNG